MANKAARGEMVGRLTTGILTIVVIAAGSGRAVLAQATTEAERTSLEIAKTQFQNEIQPLLKKYCYDCHAEGEKNGQVAFDQLETDAALLNPALWFKVLKNVRAGLMPPQGQPRLSTVEQQALEDWIKVSSFGADSKHPDPGRVTLRRLNRSEYRNSLRDLLGIDFDASSLLPPDDVGYGFDNIGDVLSLSPMRMEKFVEAGIAVVEKGVPMDTVAIASQMALPNDFRDTAGTRTGDHLSFYQNQKVSHKFNAKYAGEYRIHIAGKVDGEQRPDPQQVRVHALSDDKEFFSEEYKWSDAEYYNDERVVNWEAGEHEVSFVTQPLLDLQPLPTKMEYRILFVRVEGPLDRKLWEHPPGYSRLYDREKPPQDPGERRVYAREVLSRFAPKAFRRPVSDEMLERLVALAEKNYSLPGVPFEKGIAQAIVAVLASPNFLFHFETAQPLAAGEKYAQVDEYTLASRLSFALWCSVPDDELTQFAARGELRKNFVAQVKRMLADPKSSGFVESFSGQWLQSRGVLDTPINSADVMALEADEPAPAPTATASAAEAAPAANDATTGNNDPAGAKGRRGRNRRPTIPPGTALTPEIRVAMKQEVESYFAYVLREDRSVLEFLDSDYTFSNDVLAPVYGFPNVTGPEMHRVQLSPNDTRGGVLTMGSVLTVTSNPTRTSPVKRGKWILENILGAPPSPPPPNIPALEDSRSKVSDRQPTQRELLAIHRESPICASCHARMDPLGLALENFNAFGRYRTQEHRQPIEPSGELATGEKFSSAGELKQALVKNHKMEFYRTLADKMLIYTLGRGTEYYDIATIDRIAERMEREDGRFSALLFGVLESAPFQERRTESHAVKLESPSVN